MEALSNSTARAFTASRPLVAVNAARRPVRHGLTAGGAYVVALGLVFAARLMVTLLESDAPENELLTAEGDDAPKATPPARPLASVPRRTFQRPRGLFRKVWERWVAAFRAMTWRRTRPRWAERVKRRLRELAARRDGIWEYVLVTAAYWGFTITDGAIRMLVLFQFYLLGYSAFQIAFLFLFYEIFGVVTNLVAGWIGANFGVRITLMAGGWIQVFALTMLAFVSPAWPVWGVVSWVMISQALSGVAKDLTKMSSKSAIKSVIPDGADTTLYRWVSILTGSKNALKGAGFFVGALLLTVVGFPASLLLMAGGLVALQFGLMRHLPRDLGRPKKKEQFRSMFALDRRINILSAARFFLFGARDVWFVVALPVFMASIFGWSPLVIAGYLALWTIGYGVVQSAAPKFISAKDGGPPKAHTVVFWTTALAGIPLGISLALASGVLPALALLGGLGVFGVVFAINSAVHSFMIVHYAESEKAAMAVGFYYMANAGGRLIGTVLSGLIYQFTGIVGCLWVSTIFVAVAALISTTLALPESKRLPGVATAPLGLLPAPAG